MFKVINVTILLNWQQEKKMTVTVTLTVKVRLLLVGNLLLGKSPTLEFLLYHFMLIYLVIDTIKFVFFFLRI